MRRAIGFLASVGALGLIALAQAAPARAASTIEKSLLGVRILQTYREVLAHYGAPTRVYRLGETIYIQEDTDADGKLTGGIRALLDGAATGSGGPSGAGGAPSSGGSPSSGGGSVGGQTDETDATFAESGGYSWAYYYPQRDLFYLFIFNKEGRLLLSLERGRSGGGRTQRGVGLGDSVKSVYSNYGWPDNVEEQGPGIVLNFSQRHHVLFAILNGKVVGIAICLLELPKLRMLAINESKGQGGSGGSGSYSGKGGAPRD